MCVKWLKVGFKIIKNLDFRWLKIKYLKLNLNWKGLSYIHEKQIVHLDLKPENLIAIDDNGDKYKMAKIVDFGMAKNIGGGGVCCLDGTDGYKSPEQINFEL